MQTKRFLGILLIWATQVCLGFSAPPVHKMAPHRGHDNVAADEQRSQYPALDLEDLCKLSKNPKCEAVVDAFCLKACQANLCANHGSIRGMCRLMCEAEDLPPPCLKMGPSKEKKKKFFKKPKNQQRNPQRGQPGLFYPPSGPLQ